jgi:autotransporter translocation and assembly factor TamB
VNVRDRTLDVSAAGDASMSILQLFFDGITTAGAARLNAKVSGSFDAPRLTGEAFVADGRFRPFGSPHSLESLNGRIEFASNTINVDNVTARIGSGDVVFGGSIGLDGWYETLDPARPTFELALAMDSLDVAEAAESLVTVRTLAPVARYARGTFSADLDVNGALGEDMRPVFDALDGSGSVLTSRLAIEGMPLLERLSDMLRLSALANPTVSAIRSSIRIEDGRLHVSPFDADLAGIGVTISGSNGIDQSLDYTLGLTLPTGALGDAAASVMSDLARRAGLPAPSAGTGESVRVAVRVGGTFTEPALDLSLGNPVSSAGDAARQAAGAAVQQRVDEAQQRLDAEREEARQRARAQADSLVADAERRAEEIRAEAARLAAGVRTEANRAAEEVLARATNPIARAAAEPVAARMREEAEARAGTIEREADERANALVAETRARADQLTGAN